MAKIINYITPFNEDSLNGGFYIAFVSDNELVDGFMAHYGEEISIIDTIPTKDGYNFACWKYADGQNLVLSGSFFTVTQDTVFTAQFSQACSHNFVDGVCTSCGINEGHSEVCSHNFVGGICTICGASEGCAHTNFLNGVCSTCGYVCPHSFEDGICTICDCVHNHSYTSYTIISNKKHIAHCECGEPFVESHSFVDGVCIKCGYACLHPDYVNGKCTECNYEHTPHSYNYSYSQYSSSQHKAYCSCGVSRLESHNNIDQLSVNGDIIRRCMDCGYTVTIHTCSYTNSYSQYSSSQHRAYCECGNNQLESHTFNTSGKCTKCEYQCVNHTYLNGKCTICGYTHTPHSYNNSFSQYSDSQHRAYCVCGVSRLESHNFIDQSNMYGDIVRYCTKCGYTVTILHTCSYTNDYSQYSSSQHRAYCECGASKLESHTFNSTNTCTKCGYHIHSYTNSYSQNNSSTHFAYCACGASITEAHTFNSSNICTKCNYHVHSFTYKYKQSSSAKHEAYCICGGYILESHTALPCSKCGYPYGVIYDNAPSNDEQN